MAAGDPQVTIELWKLAASIGLPVALLVLGQLYKESTKRRDRRRKLYAAAFTACMEYKEFPYAIYRRGKLDPEAERLRISEGLNKVQKRIAYHQAWLETESSSVSKAYDALVKNLRRIAGEEMKKAWNEKPITSDKQMNLGSRIDWKNLSIYERRFIAAAKKELKPWWRFSKQLN